VARPRSRCTLEARTGRVEGPRCFLGRAVTGHGGGAQKRVSQRRRPFPVPSYRRAHQFPQRRSPPFRVYPPTPLSPSFTAPTRPPLTSNTHAHTSLHISVHLTSCTHEASLDQAITTVTVAAPFARRPSLQASSLRRWPLSGPSRLRHTPTDSWLSRAARRARSTCTSKTWPRLP